MSSRQGFTRFQSPCNITLQIHAGKIAKSSHLADYNLAF